MKDIDFVSLRGAMVTEQIVKRGISDENVISAFSNVPRELFVPDDEISFSYQDRPLPIGKNQTISQPYIVALMTQMLSVEENNKVLEIGTGSGYQSAILSYLGTKLYTIERIPELADKAMAALNSLGFNVNIKVGDGTLGWQDYSPYDRIIVTAASETLPLPFIDQLKAGGKIVAPIGGRWRQELMLFEKTKKALKKTVVCGCIFVPLVGKHGYKK